MLFLFVVYMCICVVLEHRKEEKKKGNWNRAHCPQQGAASISQENKTMDNRRSIFLEQGTQLHRNPWICHKGCQPWNAGVSEKAGWRALEAAIGMLFPVLGVLSCNKQLLHWTLELELDVIMSGHEVILQIRGFPIGWAFCSF